MSAAARQRRRRERKRCGIRVLKVAVSFDELADALIAESWLEAWDADSQEAVTRAVEAMLSASITRDG